MDAVVIIGLTGMGGMGALLSLGLVYANKKLYVPDDPLLARIKESLPSTNCGGCGFAGCNQFAEGLIHNETVPGKCAVLNEDGKKNLAGILGIDFTSEERQIARIMCQGGLDEAKLKGYYTGAKSCVASQMVGGGNKLCDYGCLGFGDCSVSCPFDAIYMNENELPVVIAEKCTGCGICVSACPKNIIELHPESRQLLVLCKSHDINKDAKKACFKSCTACGLCSPEENYPIGIMNNLAVVDYSRYTEITKQPECPRGCFSSLGVNESDAITEEEKCTVV